MMTRETAAEIYERNQPAKVSFSSYYKYRFYFKGKCGDLDLSVSFGGSADDIYRSEVTSEPRELPKTLNQLEGDYTRVSLFDPTTGEIYEFSDTGW